MAEQESSKSLHSNQNREQSSKLENISDVGGKNKTKIYCQRCPSLVLSPRQATLVQKEFFLPNMYQKNECTPIEGVTLVDFWHVSDMLTFDNVGFSKTVDNIKYLMCADCEVGPIGWHSVHDKKSYYVAVDRVKHG
ncbi:guanine nucleotide exchange factor MSS4 [Biomphalaria pfeifferi]|uniref:Guanine nucleotide exchange factor MSS4 n=1 Tax=Biomphalaria pfeifferi TaxID=112525 RepID=A0AAD8F152_BIOPF|nr:guanine nucleotide exchange factor MSS4 [Biomphalaria pfeifferi]